MPIEKAGAGAIASIMPVMNTAFDPVFGEAWTAAQCLSALAMPGSQLLIARTNAGAVAGFALSRWILEEEELLMIGVAPEFQRLGFATRLLDEIVSRARSEDRSLLFLEVRDGNKARLFYEKSGFLEVGRRKDYYHGTDNSRHDAITMSRII